MDFNIGEKRLNILNEESKSLDNEVYEIFEMFFGDTHENLSLLELANTLIKFNNEVYDKLEHKETQVELLLKNINILEDEIQELGETIEELNKTSFWRTSL